jgi:hypothetical protein
MCATYGSVSVGLHIGQQQVASKCLHHMPRTVIHVNHPHCCVLQDVFPAFFARVLALRLPERHCKLAQHEQTAYLLFMINSFQSLEDEMVRGQVRQGCVGAAAWFVGNTMRLGLDECVVAPLLRCFCK